VRLGETALAEEDIEHYDGTVVKRAIEGARAAGHLGTEIPFRDALRSDIESLVMDNKLRLLWPRVARFLAQRYQMTVPQLRRASPWAERVWREQTVLAREERRLRQQFETRNGGRT